MAKRRILKKQIRYVCGELAGTVLTSSALIPGFDQEAVPELLSDVAIIQLNALAHSTFSYDRSKSDFETARKYHDARASYYREAYRTLRDDMQQAIGKFVKKLNVASQKSK